MKNVFRIIWKVILFYWPNRKWINDYIRKAVYYEKTIVKRIRNKNKHSSTNTDPNIKEKKDSVVGGFSSSKTKNKRIMSENEKKLGIELIKKAIKTLFDTADEIAEAKKNDGEITKLELLGLGDNVIALGSQAIKVNQIIAQAKDIDSEEAKELASYIVGELGFASEDVQFILTHSFAYIQAQFDAYNEHLKPIIDKIKEMKK